MWLSPDPLGARDAQEALGLEAVDVKSLIVLEARPCAGESEAEIVAGAWNFPRIQAAYQRHLRVLEERPVAALVTWAAVEAFRRWALAEHAAWRHAVALDPMLPEPLLPQVYWGRKSWQRRVEVLRDAGQQVLTFLPHAVA